MVTLATLLCVIFLNNEVGLSFACVVGYSGETSYLFSFGLVIQHRKKHRLFPLCVDR